MARGDFARGVLLTFGTNVAQLFLGVGTSILVARLLGPEDLGRYSLALLFAVVAMTFTNLGLAPATTFLVSRGTWRVGQVVSNSTRSALVLGLAGIAGGAAVAWGWGEQVLRGVPFDITLLALTMVPATLLAGVLRGVLHGQQKFQAYNASLIGESGVKMVLLCALWITGGTLLGAVAANVVSVVVVAVALLVHFREGFSRQYWKLSTSYLRESFAYGSKAYVANGIQFLNYRVDMLLLNAWQGPAAVGFYSVAVLFAERLRMISGAASTVLFPRVAAAHASGETRSETAAVCRVVVWSSVGAALAFWAVSHWVVVLLYSASFAAAVRPLQILLIGIAALSAADVVAHDFAGRGMPIVNTTISAITLVINVVLLVVLVPRYAVEGAAWASALSYFAQTVLTLGWYLRISDDTLFELLVPRGDDLIRIRRMVGRRPAASGAA